jgi:hypothetical protein
VVINLSRYLQTLIVTGYQKLKHSKHLITNIIVTRYLNQPHATLPARLTPVGQANTAPYPAAHRDSSILTTGTINRWITPGNVYYHNCRAVVRNACPRKPHYTSALYQENPIPHKRIIQCLWPGLPQSELAYCNSRFCFLKYTKPVGERNLQALKVASQACFPATMTFLVLHTWIQY